MAESIKLELATPERELVREQVSDVQVPAKDGYLGVLPGHAPLLSLLGTGALSYGVGSRRHFIAVQGGFLEVLPEQVRVLANQAERAEDIDLEQARSSLARAQEQVNATASGGDADAALASLALAQARVTAAEQKG
jgi:F-type H+-transporting ATPase subunit epsilon